MTINKKPVVLATAQLDHSFSDNGLASFSSGLGNDHTAGFVILSSGDYLVAGWSGTSDSKGAIINGDFSLLKVKADGSLDSRFANNGWQTTNFGGNEQTAGIAALPDGRIVLVGTTNIGANSDIALARYNPNGSLDSSFSSDGMLTMSLSPGEDKAQALALQPDGKLLVLAASDTSITSKPPTLELLRYASNGDLDPTFGNNGIASANFFYWGTTGTMRLMDDGRIVVAGFSWNDASGKFVASVARFNADGSLDTRFDDDGMLQIDVGTALILLNTVEMQADGKILLAGTAGTIADSDALLLRLTDTGAFDDTFGGGDGMVLLNNSSKDRFNDLLVQADGKIVTTGFQATGLGETSVTRFNVDGSLDSSFNHGSNTFTTLFGFGTSIGSVLALDSNGQLIVVGDSWANHYQLGLLRLNGGIAQQSAKANTPFALTIAANNFYDADGDSLNYSATLADGSPLPAWLQFDPATKTVSGTPKNGDFGTNQVLVTASDGQDSATANFQLEVSTDFIEALRLTNHFRWNAHSPNGTPGSVLTYSFMDAPSSHAKGAEVSSFAMMNESQRQAVRDVLQQYSEIAGISFVETSSSGTLQFADYYLKNKTAAYTWNLGLTSEIWVNRAAPGYDQPLVGNLAYQTLMHEIGHALGLKHPGNYGAGEAPFLPKAQDNTQYSVMSYNHRTDIRFLDAVPTGNNTYDFKYTTVADSTPMLFDIATLQFLYGANHDSRSGDDIYSFDPATPFFQTLWDSAGFDSISLANFSASGVIDLRAGHFSNVPIVTDAIPKGYSGGTTPSYKGINNLAIAYGAVFEQAEGGSGNDTLIGNEFDNWLIGGLGKDTLSGGLGQDTFVLCHAGDSNIASCDVISDFELSDQIEFTGLSGMSFGLGRFTGNLANTILSIRNDQTFSNKTLFFADGSDGYLYVNGVGTGINFDETLIKLAGNTSQPKLAQLPGFDNPSNHVPMLSAASNIPNRQNLPTHSSFSFNVAADTFSDSDPGENLDYIASLANGLSLPTWLQFDNGSRNFSGVPGIGDTGTFTIRITASDSIGAHASADFTLNVKNPVNADNLNANIRDTLSGAEGHVDDILNGGKAADNLKGGLGNDIYIVDDVGDKVIETAKGGVDEIQSSISFILGKYVETLTLTSSDAISATGNGLANTLIGNDANNLLDGGAGIDTLIGGLGDDSYIVDHVGDVISDRADQGYDTLISNASNYVLSDDSEIEVLRIGKGTGKLTGNKLANRLIGNDSANTLDGAAGNDRINGGKGNDTLSGGHGADWFVFDSGLKNNVDSIGDFETGIDHLQLDTQRVFMHSSLITDADGVLDAANFRGGNSLADIKAAQDADDFILFDSTTGALYYDADGNGAGKAIKFVQLTGIVDLSAADILLLA